MSAYLINGLSGSGKTTIGNELEVRGYKVIDTDEDFGYYGNLETGAPAEFQGDKATKEWYSVNGWIWDKAKVKKAIDEADEPTFFCGGSLNENLFYKDFKEVFRLHIDADTLVKRIKSRKGDKNTNNPEFIARMLKFQKNLKAHGESLGMIIIDTASKTVSESTDDILESVR